ncbi:MAG: cytochrome c, partial [Planctomycetota bacterium]
MLSHRISTFAFVILGIFVSIGCEPSSEVNFRFNQVEWVKQERINLDDGEHFDGAYKEEIGNISTALFGTPNEPDFQFLYSEEDDPAREVLSLENLKLAAGPVKSGRHGEPAGLYREHCVQCHGISGDGKGPTAGFLNPYPRDFRVGKFKFKSTPLRRPPTDEDLTNIIRHGISGTAMPAFSTLSIQDVAALVDYVKYLSIRGQLERRLLAEVYNMDGDPLLDLSLAEEEEYRTDFEDQLLTIVEEFLIEDIVERWADADDAVTDVPVPPESFSEKSEDHLAFVESGRQLFRG